MELFKLTTATSGKTLDWPEWLQVAWEREWGMKSAFSPVGGGNYIATNSAGADRIVSVGDIITPDFFI